MNNTKALALRICRIEKGGHSVRITRNIPLSREEWEAFERKLNTIDRERERRAEAFLHEMDSFVFIKKNDGQTDINLSWLEDEILLSLLSGIQKMNTQHVIMPNSNSEPSIDKNKKI